MRSMAPAQILAARLTLASRNARMDPILRGYVSTCLWAARVGLTVGFPTGFVALTFCIQKGLA